MSDTSSYNRSPAQKPASTSALDSAEKASAPNIRRYAVIDIGTVTCRMLVADVSSAGQIHELTRKYAITNLGEGVDATGMLSLHAMERVAKTIDNYLQVLKHFRTSDDAPIHIYALATSAARDAKNAHDFINLLQKRGINLLVIPGKREAQLSFLGASSDFQDEHIVMVDIGGGSTEVVAGFSGEVPEFIHSFNIGCRRITERTFANDPPTSSEISQARTWIRQEMNLFFAQLKQDKNFADAQNFHLVAVAGTATSVVSVYENMEVYDTARVHKARVSIHVLDEVFSRLSNMALEQRKYVVGLDPERASVIVAGLVILQEICELAGVSAFYVSESDILKGVILDAQAHMPI